MHKPTGLESPENIVESTNIVSIPLPESQKVASGFSSGSATSATVMVRNSTIATPNFDSAPTKIYNPSMTATDKARSEKKDADASYIKAIKAANIILEDTATRGTVSMPRLERLLADILQIYQMYDRSLLLEITQVVRVDKQYYRYHAVNVGLLNIMIGQMMSLDEGECVRLAKIGLLLDIGMMRLPPALLTEKGKLGEEDIALIRQHPQLAVDLLRKSGEDDEVLLNAILLHHERFNGSGYPTALRGVNIPLESRISAVSDSFDAAVARKGYRKQKSPFDLLAEFSENSDQTLDPVITKAVVDGFAHILPGRYVTLSDRSVGRVISINPENLAYPVVSVVGRRLQTNDTLYPVSLSGHMPLF